LRNNFISDFLIPVGIMFAVRLREMPRKVDTVPVVLAVATKRDLPTSNDYILLKSND